MGKLVLLMTDFKSCTLTMNPPPTQKLVTHFLKVQCLDQFYSPYIYILPSGNIIKKHSVNFHCYADDTRLYLSMKPDKTSQLAKLKACLRGIKIWMTRNF